MPGSEVRAAGEGLDEQSHGSGAPSDSRRAAMRCRMSSGPNRDSNCHLGPFCRRRAPARPMNWPLRQLESLTDASLSQQRTWPGDRDSELASWLAAADCAARSDRRPPHASPTPDAARGRSGRRNGDPGHIERKVEAERDIGHKRRPENAPTAKSSKPPNTGHGSQAVMKVQSSDGIGDPEGSGVDAPGLSLF